MPLVAAYDRVYFWLEFQLPLAIISWDCTYVQS